MPDLEANVGGGASQSTDPAAGSSAATDVSLREYFAAIRIGDMRLATERDRRYEEVNIEKEKALKIKEIADLAALGLAREIQTYKDEKANELREQISSERGLYASKSDLVAMSERFDAILRPIADYVSSSRGRSDAKVQGQASVGTATALIGAVLGIIGVIITVAILLA